MNDVNPYRPPATETAPPARPARTERWLLTAVLIGTFAGGFCGSIILAPFVRGPGDPFGRSIGFALGGFAGLIGSFIFFVSARRRIPNEPQHESDERGKLNR